VDEQVLPFGESTLSLQFRILIWSQTHEHATTAFLDSLIEHQPALLILEAAARVPPVE
jgi:hypothetical protein